MVTRGRHTRWRNIDATFIACTSIDAALRISAEWDGVAMHFIVDDVGYNVTLNLWRAGGHTVACLYLQTSIVWYEAYHFVYRPLDPASVLARIANGSLFQIHDPMIHLVAVELIAASVVTESIARHGSRDGLQYATHAKGYHVLWNT